jgi:hypothetical protein
MKLDVYVHILVSGVTPVPPPPALQGFLHGGGGVNINLETLRQTIPIQ